MKNCDGYGHLHLISMFVTKFKIAVFALYFSIWTENVNVFFLIFYSSNVSTFGRITNIVKICFLKYKICYRRDPVPAFGVNFVESYATFVQRIVS